MNSIRMYYYESDNPDPYSEQNRLVPVPQISITPEYYYANDTVIGYTYNLDLAGYATSLDTRVSQTGVLGFTDTLRSIKNIKNIFNRNDGILEIIDSSGTILKAIGGTIRGLNFQESPNLWINYSQYSAQIEFNEIQFSDCIGLSELVACSSVPSGITDSPQLLDMKQYKVKSFNDGWSFSIDDSAYNTYGIFKNELINISYNISANGKHYFVEEKLLPAWEQAKNFCQYRLKQQVNRLVRSVLRIPDYGSQCGEQDSCKTDGTLHTIFNSGLPGLLDGLSEDDFEVYNEKISCTTSEGNGTFDANYTAILKRKYTEATGLAHPDCIHTFNISRNLTDDGRQKNIQLNLQGNIMGLVPGGLVRSSGILVFPNQGSIFISTIPSGNKYNNALIAYNKIGDNKALYPQFLSYVGITNQAVGVAGSCVIASGVPPTNSLNVVHNYIDGSINYSASFDSIGACRGSGNAYSSINISVEEKTPLIAEFVVPGRQNGPIIQRLNTFNPKKITINIEGANPAGNCCGNISLPCDTAILLSGIPNINPTGAKLTQNQYTTSIDGSFSLSRAYIVCD